MQSEVFISESEIATRICSLAKEISEYYSQKNITKLVIIGVLKGAYIFTADLVRAIKNIQLQIEFVRISSYGDSTQSSGVIATPDLALPANIYGQHILLVEDIVDTGRTASFLVEYITQQFKPESLTLVSFLDKPSRRVVEIEPNFCGFVIEDKFVIGYGLDYAERYRELAHLAVLSGVSE